MRDYPVILWAGLIGFYRMAISPFIGRNCRFYPSCSAYSLLAVRQHGIVRGVWLTVERILRCHPFHPGGVDWPPDCSVGHHSSECCKVFSDQDVS